MTAKPTFESILQFVIGKKSKVLLKKMKYDNEGNVIQWGTKKGEEAYSQLVDLLYGIGKLVNMEKEVSSIVDELDELTTQETF